MKTDDKSKGGRPTKYKEGFGKIAFNLCLIGVTDAQLAEYFEINPDTLYEWKKSYPEFADAVKRGKLEADGQVAAALFKRAVGFTYDEVTFEKIGTEELSGEDPDKTAVDLYRKKVVRKMVVPDTGAAMNWLSNRQKELWANKLNVQATGAIFNSVPLTPEKMKAIRDAWENEY